MAFFEIEEHKMAWKNLKQRTSADDLMVDHAILEEYDDVSNLIDRKSIESMLNKIHSKRHGEKAWPPLMISKALSLQSWYGLSDPGLEKQLVRDI